MTTNLTDPRVSPIHEAARALDQLARIHTRKRASLDRAKLRVAKRYREQEDAILGALSPEALEMVKRQVGDA